MPGIAEWFACQWREIYEYFAGVGSTQIQLNG